MKSNLAQHPCANKCTNFKDEQCNTCLIKGTIPTEFITGDVVVLKDLNILCVTDLITLKSFDGQFWETDHRIGRVSEKTWWWQWWMSLFFRWPSKTIIWGCGMILIENLYIQQAEVDHFKTMNQRYIGKMQEQQDQIAELKNQLACCREENKGLVESLSKSQIRISECLSLSKSWSETEFKKTTHWSEGYEAACGNCSIELDQVLRDKNEK